MKHLALIALVLLVAGCSAEESKNTDPRVDSGHRVVRGSFEALALPDGTKCVTNSFAGGVACDFSSSWKPEKKYAPLVDPRRRCKTTDRYDGSFVVICTPPEAAQNGI